MLKIPSVNIKVLADCLFFGSLLPICIFSFLVGVGGLLHLCKTVPGSNSRWNLPFLLLSRTVTIWLKTKNRKKKKSCVTKNETSYYSFHLRWPLLVVEFKNLILYTPSFSSKNFLSHQHIQLNWRAFEDATNKEHSEHWSAVPGSKWKHREQIAFAILQKK